MRNKKTLACLDLAPIAATSALEVDHGTCASAMVHPLWVAMLSPDQRIRYPYQK
jgi:hypothetical protein